MYVCGWEGDGWACGVVCLYVWGEGDGWACGVVCLCVWGGVVSSGKFEGFN